MYEAQEPPKVHMLEDHAEKPEAAGHVQVAVSGSNSRRGPRPHPHTGGAVGRVAVGAIPVFLGICLSASSALAGEGVTASEAVAFRGLQWQDWAVVAVYGLFMIGLGVYYCRRQTTTEDYFLAGRKTRPLVAGI